MGLAAQDYIPGHLPPLRCVDVILPDLRSLAVNVVIQVGQPARYGAKIPESELVDGLWPLEAVHVLLCRVPRLCDDRIRQLYGMASVHVSTPPPSLTTA